MSAGPYTVLVVDDEPPIRKLLRMGLATEGYKVLEAPNGKAALELMELPRVNQGENPATIRMRMRRCWGDEGRA